MSQFSQHLASTPFFTPFVTATQLACNFDPIRKSNFDPIQKSNFVQKERSNFVQKEKSNAQARSFEIHRTHQLVQKVSSDVTAIKKAASLLESQRESVNAEVERDVAKLMGKLTSVVDKLDTSLEDEMAAKKTRNIELQQSIIHGLTEALQPRIEDAVYQALRQSEARMVASRIEKTPTRATQRKSKDEAKVKKPAYAKIIMTRSRTIKV